MPYHLSTLLGSDVVGAEAYLTRREAEQEAERRALKLAENTHTYRLDRCGNSHLCTACLKAGFDQADKWPRRGTDWRVFDRGTHVEILRQAETMIFEEDEEAAAFVVLAAQNPGTPDTVRRECQLALGEILVCNSLGIEAWRETYGGSNRWQEILGCEDEEDDPPCACEGSGLLVMNEERYEPEEALGEIQACDCGIFKTDDDAIEAARAAGYTVTDEGLVLSEPFRQRALRRWGA